MINPCKSERKEKEVQIDICAVINLLTFNLHDTFKGIQASSVCYFVGGKIKTEIMFFSSEIANRYINQNILWGEMLYSNWSLFFLHV